MMLYNMCMFSQKKEEDLLKKAIKDLTMPSVIVAWIQLLGKHSAHLYTSHFNMSSPLSGTDCIKVVMKLQSSYVAPFSSCLQYFSTSGSLPMSRFLASGGPNIGVSASASVQFSSGSQSCLTLCDSMNCSTPGLPVHHQLPEFTQTCPSSQWYHPGISSSVIPFSSCPQSLPASESFPMSQPFPWGGQSTGVSALASVLPMNTQDWSPLGWTGWISLQSKELSSVFSNITVQKHQFFGAQPSSQSNSHIHTWPLEKP